MKTKEKLLKLLKSTPGEWISGEGLSQTLEMSRSAISKQIKRLKELGYEIASAPHKGYCLTPTIDVLRAEEIQEQLPTQFLGQGEVLCFDSIDSTNLKAKALASQGAAEGTVVLAQSQTMGRGRKGRSWSSPCGTGVYLSLILRPDFPPRKATQLTFLTAVAAVKAIEKMGEIDVKIKWPNDLLIGRRKLAGILTEISTDTEAINYAVVGLGININTPSEGYDTAVKSIAVSLQEASGQRHTRLNFVRHYLVEFEKYYHQMLNEGFSTILDLWKKHSNIIGRDVEVSLIDTTLQGVATDIEVDGVLMVTDNKGKTHSVYSGDIKIAD